MKMRLLLACAATVGVGQILLADGDSSKLSSEWWEREAVVLADVTDFHEAIAAGEASELVIHPIATLSGMFDAGAQPSLSIQLPREVFSWRAKKGDRCLVAVYHDANDRGYHLSNEWLPYMPGVRRPLWTFRETNDKVILDTLRVIRERRSVETGRKPEKAADLNGGYWSLHCLVYGTIRGNSQMSGNKPTASVDLESTLTIAGRFDTGVTRRLTANVDPRIFTELGKPLPAGGNAIFLLKRDGQSWATASERADFMPGDHAPVCAVEDFGDPKVESALSAIQKSREKAMEKSTKTAEAKK